MATSLLDLTTLTVEERPTVRIDGVAYPFKRIEELPVLSWAFVVRKSKQFEAMQGREEFSEEEEREISGELRRMVRLIVDAPAAVINKLTDLQIISVCDVFTALLQAPSPQTGADPQAQANQTTATGAKSSRRLSGSMAATHGTGSRRSRSRS